MHPIAYPRSRRFIVAVAVTLAALLIAGVSTAVRSAQSQTTSTAAAVTTTTANRAFSGFRDNATTMPNSLGKIATLNIPVAGSYVINAKLGAFNGSSTSSPLDTCVLTAGADFDELPFDVAGNGADNDETLALQLVHTFGSPGSVTLSCTDNGVGSLLAVDTKITAVQVAELSNVQI